MARKRFKILEGALDYLRTPGDDDNPDAPLNTPLRQYQEWRKGTRNVSYTRRDDSLPGEINDASLIPFFFTYEEANRILVPISQRAQNETVMNPFLTAANVDTGDTQPARRYRNFIPAKVTVSVLNAQLNDPNAVSQLTGVTYKKLGKESYTIPYGAKSATTREADVRADIRAAVPEGQNYTLVFESEKI